MEGHVPDDTWALLKDIVELKHVDIIVEKQYQHPETGKWYTDFHRYTILSHGEQALCEVMAEDIRTSIAEIARKEQGKVEALRTRRLTNLEDIFKFGG